MNELMSQNLCKSQKGLFYIRNNLCSTWKFGLFPYKKKLETTSAVFGANLEVKLPVPTT